MKKLASLLTAGVFLGTLFGTLSGCGGGGGGATAPTGVTGVATPSKVSIVTTK